ncbi:L-threonylcarbamoyladenylate synthase, partial [uncultured Megasphaera sp.]
MKTELLKITDIEQQQELLRQAGACIRQGGLVVFPTETVYGLGANGLDETACRRIFEAKGRPSDNPLILTVADRQGAEQISDHISPLAEKLMARFWPGPLTLVLPRRSCVPDVATGGLDTVAVRCPDHDICRAFLQYAQVPVAGPSANLSTRPSPTTAAEAL